MIAPVPTGAVFFYDNGTFVGSRLLNAGKTFYSTTALGVGGHFIKAVYPGDINSRSSTSGILIQIVNNSGVTATSSTTLTQPKVSPLTPGQPAGSVHLGQQVSFVASVSCPSLFNGRVTFMDNDVPLDTEVVNSSVNSGRAAFTTSNLTLGSHSIIAVYSGDTSCQGSFSSAATVRRTPRPR